MKRPNRSVSSPRLITPFGAKYCPCTSLCLLKWMVKSFEPRPSERTQIWAPQAGPMTASLLTPNSLATSRTVPSAVVMRTRLPPVSSLIRYVPAERTSVPSSFTHTSP
jgi:hypothetical protein